MTTQYIPDVGRPTQVRARYNSHIPARISALVREIADREGLGVREILGPSRCRRVAFARFEVWWRLRNSNGPERVPSYPMIGRWFRRDHTTVIHGVRRYIQLAEMRT